MKPFSEDISVSTNESKVVIDTELREMEACVSMPDKPTEVLVAAETPKGEIQSKAIAKKEVKSKNELNEEKKAAKAEKKKNRTKGQKAIRGICYVLLALMVSTIVGAVVITEPWVPVVREEYVELEVITMDSINLAVGETYSIETEGYRL